jgi:hypothetical protein
VPHGHHQPVGGGQVRIHEDLAVPPGPVVDATEPEPTFDPHGRGGEGMAPAASGDQRGGQPAGRLPGIEIDVGRHRLADPDGRSARLHGDGEGGRDAPGQDVGQRALRVRRTAYGGCVAGGGGQQGEDDERRDGRRQEEECERRPGHQCRQPGGRAHRGTGTEASAAATASSGR